MVARMQVRTEWVFALQDAAGEKPALAEEFIIEKEEKYLGNT